MTNTNVQLVQEIYTALGSNDVDAATRLLADEFQVHQRGEVPWGGSFSGTEGFLDFIQLLFQSITTVVEITEFVESGKNVVAIGTTRGTANQSGHSFDLRVVHVWEVQGERLSKFEIYVDDSAMRKALQGA